MVNTTSRYQKSPMLETRRVQIGKTVLELVQGDIVQESTDVIVNAANSSLMGGGGVDGAIHRAAGPELLEETRNLGGCRTGDAKISGGYRLKASHVIHTVGPIYQPKNPDVPKLLASAYRRSLEVAVENNLTSLSFPAISTGVYGYPLHEAAQVALKTTIDFLQMKSHALELVRFVLYTPEGLGEFAAALDDLVD
jgi:O-acetyl-ADP-ribose deacetylase (regulator of RNase III)